MTSRDNIRNIDLGTEVHVMKTARDEYNLMQVSKLEAAVTRL